MRFFGSAGFRSANPQRRVYFGWWVSIAGAFNMVFSAGPTFQATSVLFKAIEDEFGWSRTLISGVATFGRLGTTLLGPLEGWLVDTFGSGRMVLIGFTLGGAGLIFFSQINGPVPAANAWMTRRRALGMSIVEGGVSVGGLMVPLIVWGISEHGWRPTVLVMGVLAILVGPLIAWVVGKRPTAEELATQVVPTGEGRRRRVRESSHDFTVKEALQTRAFWSISFTHMLVNLSTGGISAHLFLHLSDDNGVGLDVATASAIVPILVATAFVSQLLGGIAGDRWDKRMLVPFLALTQGVSLIVLAVAESFLMAAVFAVVWGIGFGARTPMLLAMRGEYFGRRHFASIFALSSFPMSIGMMLTPVIVGWSHDVWKTYDWSLYVLAGFCVAASVTVLFATRPMTPEVRKRLEARRSLNR
ncbi:MAG: MFS transporter [Chloroflexi bacterium]|nr:MFS transporter [Chloroflexota bacterium]